jgi:predicted dehydrogenase
MTALRWGVLSTAKIGVEKVIPATQQGKRCEVVAIASRELAKAESVAERLDIPAAYGSYEELLASPEVDAVYVALPNHLHAEWTIAAARAGKHVLCEKPLAMSSAEAQEMVDVCRDAGVVLMEAFMYRLHPSWETARRIVAEGRLGRLQTVQSWFSYYNDDPRNIRNVLEYGGGALMDIGCYSINLSRMLFGEEPSRVSSTVVRDPQTGVDIVTSAILEFGEGVATFSCSTRCEPDQRVHIYGSGGRLSIEVPFNIPTDRPVRLFLASGSSLPTDEAETLTVAPANQYTLQAERFAAAVLDGAPVPTPPEDGVANMRVIERLLGAARV